MASRLFPLHPPIALESASTRPPSHQVMEASPNVLSSILERDGRVQGEKTTGHVYSFTGGGMNTL